jgi:hypothetical protein
LIDATCDWINHYLPLIADLDVKIASFPRQKDIMIGIIRYDITNISRGSNNSSNSRYQNMLIRKIIDASSCLQTYGVSLIILTSVTMKTNKYKNVRRRSSSNSSSITKLDDSDYNKYHHDYHASKVMKNIIIETQEYIDISLMIINDDDNDNNVNNNTNDNADKVVE